MELHVNNFNVRVAIKQDDELLSGGGQTILELLSDTDMFKLKPTVIIADPFLFVFKGELYLFYEKQIKWYGLGRICMRKTKNLNDWSEEKEVLRENFHLSFPFVFENRGQVYLMPETGHDGSVRLYECTDDTLEHWQLKAKLLDDGCDWVDSSLIEEGGKYFLFTAKKEDNESYKQFLFISNEIRGPYHEHPMSPIYIGDDFGRNSGSVFKYEGSWMRPTQDCSVGYGDNVSLFKISDLTETIYKETLFKKDIFDRTGKYHEGGHQLNFVTFQGTSVIATDFKVKNYNVIELIRRILKKLKR